jgi:phage repressor protein C with HTH and peptisase S24 domain
VLSHARIWSAIDRLAERNDLTTSGLARRAGLDATTFNKSKRASPDGRLRWPSTESLAKILEATQTQMEAFLELMAGETKSRSRRKRSLAGQAEVATEGFFDGGARPAGRGFEQMTFPGGQDVFALVVAGNSMMPLYRRGDRLIVARDAPLRRGDRVVVRTSKGEVMGKSLRRKTARLVELASFDPSRKPVTLAVPDIDWMARILWASQ